MGNKKSTIRMLPIPAGTYSVGCVDIMNGYGVDGVFIRLFYPIQKCQIESHASQLIPWVPRREYLDGYANYVNIPSSVLRCFYDYAIGETFIPALRHAPVMERIEANRFPVLIFSHGLAANRTTYSTICCDMASQGFLVAAIEHREGSASWTYCVNRNEHIPDSIVEQPIKYRRIVRGEKEFPIRHSQIKIRVEECRKAIELLRAIDKGEQINNLYLDTMDLGCFKDRLDLDRLAIMGHSFGGATVIAAIASDEPYRVGIVLDGWMFPLHNDIYAQARKPLLFINMEAFQFRENILRMKRLDSTSIDRPMFTIRYDELKDIATGSVHQSQTDSTFLMTGWLSEKMHARGRIEPILCNDINNELCLAFLRKHLALQSTRTIEDVAKHYQDWIIVGSDKLDDMPASL